MACQAALAPGGGKQHIDDKQTVFVGKRHFAAQMVDAVAHAAQTVTVRVGIRFGGGKAAARVAAFALIAVFRADDEQTAAQIGAQGDGFILSVRQGGHGFDGVVEQVADDMSDTY